MQLDQPLPAAPAPGAGGGHDPYDFLYQKPPKKGAGNILPSGNSTKQRLLIVVVGGLVVFTIFIIVIAIILGSGKGNSKDLVKLAQDQSEIIRVSSLVSITSHSPTTLGFSQNIEFSTISDQNSLISYMGKHGVKANAKILAKGKNPQTDQTLSNASQAGDYDNVAVSTLQSLETSYQKELATVYKGAPVAQKQLLQTFYTHSLALVKNPPAVAPDSNS